METSRLHGERSGEEAMGKSWSIWPPFIRLASLQWLAITGHEGEHNNGWLAVRADACDFFDRESAAAEEEQPSV